VNVEQRLVAALHNADRVEPSDDLFARVLHSIEEDRAHRSRIRRSVAIAVAAAAALVTVGVLNIVDVVNTRGNTIGRRQVRWEVMELLETLVLVLIVGVLGPAIRRFGRGYCEDLWPATPLAATRLLQLLDVAYALVFAGYIAMTVEFESGVVLAGFPEQLHDASVRVGGLVLVMGVLHAVTLVLLPLVALVSNSTRVGARLPRWVTVILVLIGLAIAQDGLVLVTIIVSGVNGN
jgi:hypothetical protein